MSPTSTHQQSLVIAGAGRAGTSFAVATERAGWSVTTLTHAEVDSLTQVPNVDLFLVCVPDDFIANVAAQLQPTSADTVIAHCSGSVSIAELATHPHIGGVHPLVSLAGGDQGADALRGAWFGRAHNTERAAVVIGSLIDALNGQSFLIADADRGIYHAAAAVASNHLVALSAQVERLAAAINVPTEVYWDLMAQTMTNIRAVGPKAALTGPVARGDWDTVRAHLAALSDTDRDTYLALAQEAARLANRDLPEL